MSNTKMYNNLEASGNNSIRKFAIIILSLIIIITPFMRGLFFPEDQVKILIFASLLALTAAFYVWRSRSYGVTNLTFLSHPIDFLILALPLVYIISGFNAVNLGLSVDEILVNVLYFVIFWCASRLIITQKSAEAVLAVIFSTAFVLSIVGLAAATDIIAIKDGYINGRIYSTLQYPNALASYLGVGLLIGLYFLNQFSRKESSTIKDKSKYISVGISIVSFIILLVFWATGSRGGFLVFAATLPVFIFFSFNKKRLLIEFIIIALGAIPSSTMFLRSVEAGNLGMAWLWVLLGMLVVFIAKIIMWFVYSRFNSRKLKMATAGIFGLAGVSGLVYFLLQGGVGNIISRFSNLRTASTRVEFISAATEMIKERPLLGWGGGGWQEMYQSYLGYFYNTNEAHSYIFQVGVETGIIGMLVVLAIVVVFIKLVFDLAKEGYRDLAALLGTSAMLVFVHATIDFNLSLAALTIVLMVILAITRGLLIQYSDVKSTTDTKNNVQFITSLALIGVVTLGGLMLFSANKALAASYNHLKSNNYGSAIDQAEWAVSLNPYNAEYKLYLSDLMLMVGEKQRAEQELTDAIQKNPYNTAAKLRLANFYLSQKEFDKALDESRKVIELEPLRGTRYEQHAAMLVNVVQQQLYDSKNEGIHKHISEILKLPQLMNDRYNQLSETEKSLWTGAPPLNKLTPNMRLLLGQARCYAGDYDMALKELAQAEKGVNSKDTKLKGEILLWKAAALEKANVIDESKQAYENAIELYPKGAELYSIIKQTLNKID
ncbi:O-antigen ligase family protein [Peptococcaceae bacterium 1198_IL3148]